ncbi:hypothetical protein [Nocardia brasiliensis]
MSPEQRIELLGCLLTASDHPLHSRAAAVIVLLYAQPLTRVVRLTIDDVIHDGDLVLLRLGEPASPVPEPVAEILLAWIDSRTNMNTATNRDSRWLFPGRRAGQPMHPETLGGLLKVLGVLNVPGRTSAMRQHVQQMPAPVVADALGYHHDETRRGGSSGLEPLRHHPSVPLTRLLDSFLRQHATVNELSPVSHP